jgi:hypothetical protein
LIVRQPLPDREQQARHNVDRAFRELGHLGKLRHPGRSEAPTVRFDPVALRHHAQGDRVLIHRPDQTDAPLDLAVIEHDARRGDLHGGSSRALIDQQDGLTIGKTSKSVIQTHRMIALALCDSEQPGLGAGPRWS